MHDSIKCPRCEVVMNPIKDHTCKDNKGRKATITKYAIAGRIRRAKEGKCPGCGGTGKEIIHHLKDEPEKKPIPLVTDYVEENICPECGGSGKWTDGKEDK